MYPFASAADSPVVICDGDVAAPWQQVVVHLAAEEVIVRTKREAKVLDVAVVPLHLYHGSWGQAPKRRVAAANQGAVCRGYAGSSTGEEAS